MGGWIAGRLGPFGSRVSSVAPRGFEAYARVLHPVSDADAAEQPNVTWAEVCAWTGRRAHARMQWDEIAGAADAGTGTMRWPGVAPQVGSLDSDTLALLCQVLAPHTRPDDTCYFALWEGYGWIHGSPSVAVLGSTNPVPPAFPPEVINGPRLQHPHRNYILFSGPLMAALEMGYQVTADWFDPQSPNLFWPAGRAWCVATEIDFDSTIVAGSSALVASVLAAPALEAWPINPDDSLAHDGDTLNT